MARVSIYRSESHDAVLAVFYEDLYVEVLMKVIMEIYDAGPPENIIYDFRLISSNTLDSTDIDKILTGARSKSHLRKTGRTGIVAVENFAYGLARMYSIKREFQEEGLQTEVFRTLDDVCAWMDIPADVFTDDILIADKKQVDV